MRLIPAFISLLLLGAHSWRWGDSIGILCWCSLIVLLFSGRAWARSIVTLGLAGGIGVWIMTTKTLLGLRLAHGMPYERLLGIMGVVILFSFLSGMLLWGRKAAHHFSQGKEHASTQGVACVGVMLLLGMATLKARIPLLLADRFLPGAGRLEILWLGIYAALLLGRFLESS